MCNKIMVSLLIKHPDKNLEPAARKMGITPFRIWMAGSQRETPKGRMLDGTYDYSYCCLRLENREELCGSDFIRGILYEIEKHSECWTELTSSGGEISFVLFNEQDKRNYADKFDCQLLERLSKLKISLGFEL